MKIKITSAFRAGFGDDGIAKLNHVYCVPDVKGEAIISEGRAEKVADDHPLGEVKPEEKKDEQPAASEVKEDSEKKTAKKHH